MSTAFLLLTVMAASAVEMVEALTIVLASGTTRGWRSTLEGAGVALLAIGAIVAIFGQALVVLVPIDILRLVIGVLLLVFGLQWLRKAILRASGYKALHDELAIYQHEVSALSIGSGNRGSRDATAFVVSFKGVFLEGLEVVVIVISFGASSGNLGIAALGAAVAALVSGVAGLALLRPLASVPENAMKMGVSLMLVSFGTFWGGEGAGMEWPGADLFILVLLAIFGLATFIMVFWLKKRKTPLVSEVRP